jgi:hypothetical protein
MADQLKYCGGKHNVLEVILLYLCYLDMNLGIDVIVSYRNFVF